jgi:predicted MFS family arabinose efflux permease
VTQENKSVAILALGFGLVGIDRFLISTMFPVIAKDLHLVYNDIGVITSALAFAWGLTALSMGNLCLWGTCRTDLDGVLCW